MSEHDVQDGEAIFDRIGQACDRLAAAGYGTVARAIGGRARERRGKVKAATSIPFKLGHELIDLAVEADRLASAVEVVSVSVPPEPAPERMVTIVQRLLPEHDGPLAHAIVSELVRFSDDWLAAVSVPPNVETESDSLRSSREDMDRLRSVRAGLKKLLREPYERPVVDDPYRQLRLFRNYAEQLLKIAGPSVSVPLGEGETGSVDHPKTIEVGQVFQPIGEDRCLRVSSASERIEGGWVLVYHDDQGFGGETHENHLLDPMLYRFVHDKRLRGESVTPSALREDDVIARRARSALAVVEGGEKSTRE